MRVSTGWFTPDSKSQLIEKTLILAKIEGKRKFMAEDKIDSITNPMDMNLSKFWETVEDKGSWHAAVHMVAKSQTGLSD